jgi:hypothetical protein
MLTLVLRWSSLTDRSPTCDLRRRSPPIPALRQESLWQTSLRPSGGFQVRSLLSADSDRVLRFCTSAERGRYNQMINAVVITITPIVRITRMRTLSRSSHRRIGSQKLAWNRPQRSSQTPSVIIYFAAGPLVQNNGCDKNAEGKRFLKIAISED